MSRQLTNQETVIVIGLLVERLGGDVTLTLEEVTRARGDMELESTYDPATMKTLITARRKPETIAGEVVTAEAQSAPLAISATMQSHQHESWQLAWRLNGWLFCRACGADVEYDERMKVNT